MQTLFDAAARSSIHKRIDQISVDTPRQWGTMDAGQMVCHVSDQLRVALGDLESVVKPSVLRFKPLRYLLVYWLPWPKGKIQTAPEMLTTKPDTWREDVSSLHDLVDRVADADAAYRWGPHPMFGSISRREWGLLCLKHLDHHLRQFGV